MADETDRVVDAYYSAWGSGDFDRVGALLTDDFLFHGPMGDAAGPAAFVSQIQRNAPMFGDVQFTDVRRIVDGDRAVNLYTFEAGHASVPMAEAFEVRGDRISRIDLYFDPSPFVSGAQAG
jgi:ketosteroid isomerase-like protein